MRKMMTFIGLLLLGLSHVAVARECFVYFGTFTNELSRGIYVSRMNLDTGNTYIAGQDPAAFLSRFADRVKHAELIPIHDALPGGDGRLSRAPLRRF